MIRKLSVPVVLATALIAGIGSVVRAQEPGRGGAGGFPSPDESFRRLDQNGNDLIDPDEWETLPPPVRRAFENHADLSRPMKRGTFLEASSALRKEWTRRTPNGGDREGSRGESAEGSSDSAGRHARSSSEGRERDTEDHRPAESAFYRKNSRTVARTAISSVRINAKLPDDYRSRDTDGDGQIGLYEWPRSDYAGFRRLDLNDDGFLTPRELLRGPSALVLPRVDTNSQASDASPGGTSKAGPTSPPASDTASSNTTQQKNPAEMAFKLLDRNKDGSISEEEWKKSLSTGPAFAKAGIMVTPPISRTEFFRLYPQAYPSSVKNQ
jgi:hypothetical protein